MALVLSSGDHSLRVTLVTPPRTDGEGSVRVSVTAQEGPTRLPSAATLRNERGQTLDVSVDWSAGLPGSSVTHRLAFRSDAGALFDWDG